MITYFLAHSWNDIQKNLNLTLHVRIYSFLYWRGFCCLQSKRLEDAKRNLEDETLKRTDLQNQLLSLEESNKFDRSMLENQLSETR